MDLSHIDPELLAMVDRHIVRVGWAGSAIIAAIVFRTIAAPLAEIISAFRRR